MKGAKGDDIVGQGTEGAQGKLRGHSGDSGAPPPLSDPVEGWGQMRVTADSACLHAILVIIIPTA